MPNQRVRLEDGDVATIWVSQDGQYGQMHYAALDLSTKVELLFRKKIDGQDRFVTQYGLMNDKNNHFGSWLECGASYARGQCLIGRVSLVDDTGIRVGHVDV